MDLQINQTVLVFLLGLPHRATVHSFPEKESEAGDCIFVVVERDKPGRPIPVYHRAVHVMPFLAVMDDHSVHDLGGHADMTSAWKKADTLVDDTRSIALILDYLDVRSIRNAMKAAGLKQLEQT